MIKTSQQDLEDLTLLLAYLNSWDENQDKKLGEDPVLKSKKGYDFKVLNILKEKNLISESHKTESLYITEEGIYRAKLLAMKILGEKN